MKYEVKRWLHEEGTWAVLEVPETQDNDYDDVEGAYPVFEGTLADCEAYVRLHANPDVIFRG